MGAHSKTTAKAGRQVAAGRESRSEMIVRETDLATLDDLPGDSLALFCPEDVRPLAGVMGLVDWRVCGAISHILERETFTGERGDVVLLPVWGRMGPRRLFIFGIGSVTEASDEILRRSFENALEVLRRAGVEDLLLAAPADRDGDLETRFEAIVQRLGCERGMLLRLRRPRVPAPGRGKRDSAKASGVVI